MDPLSSYLLTPSYIKLDGFAAIILCRQFTIFLLFNTNTMLKNEPTVQEEQIHQINIGVNALILQ
jgi:hypothetical protein